MNLYLPGVGEELLCVEEVEQEGERDEYQARHPQRPSKPGSASGAHPTDSSLALPCFFCHDTTLQHYRILSLTKGVTRQQLIDQFHPDQDFLLRRSSLL